MTDRRRLSVPVVHGNEAEHRRLLAQAVNALLSSQAATQAEMEAATDTSKTVTPGSTQFHPGVAKVWGFFSGTDASVIAQYGVSGVVKLGTGLYNVTFAQEFSDADYCFIGVGGSAPEGVAIVVNATNKTTTTVDVKVFRASTETLFDASVIEFVIFGDQQ